MCSTTIGWNIRIKNHWNLLWYEKVDEDEKMSTSFEEVLHTMHSHWSHNSKKIYVIHNKQEQLDINISNILLHHQDSHRV